MFPGVSLALVLVGLPDHMAPEGCKGQEEHFSCLNTFTNGCLQWAVGTAALELWGWFLQQAGMGTDKGLL